MMRVLILIPSALSLIYAFSVHLFLAFFHERHFAPIKHWRPISIRLLHVIVVGLTTLLWKDDDFCTNQSNPQDGGYYYWDMMQPSVFFAAKHSISKSMVVVTNLLISTYFIRNTRRKEVDGPIPPFPELSTDASSISSNKTLTSEVLSMHSRVVLITGANAGIGLETARQLYERGAIVVFGCRSRDRAIEAMKNIDPSAKINENTSTITSEAARMYFLPLDLTSISSVKKAFKIFDDMKLPLHILINNAGVMRQKREETVDGLEMTMAANVSCVSWLD